MRFKDPSNFQKELKGQLLPPTLVEEVIFSVSSVCVYVCPAVCTLQAEPLDVWT